MTEFNLSEAIDTLKPLAGFVLGIVIYAIFIFKFYRFLARRDIIKLDLTRHARSVSRIPRVLFYLLENIVIFPVIVFFWYAVLVTLLSLLAKDQPPESILLVSIGLWELFALLGIYLVDQSYFELSVSVDILEDMPDRWNLIAYYLMFTVALEFVLRIGHGAITTFWWQRDRPTGAGGLPAGE